MNKILEDAAITTLKNNLSNLADLFCEHFCKKKEDNNINAINTLLVLNDKNGDTDARKKRLKTLEEEEGKTIDAGLEYANSLKNITALSRDECLDLSKKYLSTLKEILQTTESNIQLYSRGQNIYLFRNELPKEKEKKYTLLLLISAAKRLDNE